MTTSYRINKADWSGDHGSLTSIRSRVFIDEQSVPAELEWDDNDETALHWLALTKDKQAIGTLRMLTDGHIGRMAVLSEYRQQGVGMALLQAAIATAKDLQLREVYLYAQTHTVNFYRQASFVCFGEEFMDANIPHRTMRRTLTQHRKLGIHGGNYLPSSFKQAIMDLIPQARQYIRILSYDLDPNNFDNDEIQQALSSLARKSRYTEIRILLVDAQKITKQGHRIQTLQRRLSSKILLKTVSGDGTEVKENLVLADDCGIIFQSIADTGKLWANFNNKAITTNYINQFDELWARSIDNKNLRQIGI